MPPGSPYPGPWSTDLTPWLRQPMRDFADPHTDIVVLMIASQMGKTELGLNVQGWMWDTHPAPSMWVTPTERLAHTMSKDRINAMFDSVPGLWDRTRKPVRPGSLERYVSGVRFGLSWAGSATELASHPCKYVHIDERSRMGSDVGGEGDPVRVVMARTKMYAGAKIGIYSSPTDEETCPTYQWWLQGTKMRWCWRCQSCGEWYVPTIEHAGYPERAPFDVIRAEAWMCCPTCEHRTIDADRADIESGYVPCAYDDASRTLRLEPELEVRNTIKSYWCTGFSSHVTGIGRIMEEYARARRTGEPGDLQAVVNTYAGELWKLAGEGVAADAVRARQVPAIPDDEIQLVTAGVDVQQDCVYYVVRGWCHLTTSYLLDYGRILGATDYHDVWIALARVLEGTFCGLTVRATLVDAGYSAATVYEQCRRRPRWEPARGHARQVKPYHDSLVDETVTGRARKTLRLWHHCNDTWKTWLYGKIQWPFGEAGAWYVPDGISDAYCEQVTNEQVRVTRGRRDWHRTGNRENHYLDAEILAAIAADMHGVRRLPAPRQAEPEKPAPEVSSWARQRQAAVNSQSSAGGDPFEPRGL